MGVFGLAETPCNAVKRGKTVAKPVIVSEAGKVLSGANESKLRQIWALLSDVFGSANVTPDTTAEAVTPVTEALSSSDLAIRLQRALKDSMYTLSTYPYIRDIYPTFFVYSGDYGSKLQAVPYTVGANNLVTLGTPVEVLARTIYENIDGTVFAGSEAAVIDPLDVDLIGDSIQLREDFDVNLAEAATASAKPRTIRAKLISPGRGSSAIYTEAVLKRDGPKVFTKGLHMYVDHPTAKEELEKPEGTVTRLAGVLASGAVYEADNTHGPGLYADIDVFPSFYDRLKEIAPYTGLSIRAKGKAVITEANTLPTVQEFTQARSVDFVTMAGAGGKVVDLFESYRNVAIDSVSNSLVEGENGMAVTDEAFNKLQEAVTSLSAQITSLVQASNNRIVTESATDVVQAALRTSTLPAQAKQRVQARVLANLPLAESGVINHEGLQALIARESTQEANYLSSMGVGSVRGMGLTGTIDTTESAADLAAEVDKLIMAL